MPAEVYHPDCLTKPMMASVVQPEFDMSQPMAVRLMLHWGEKSATGLQKLFLGDFDIGLCAPYDNNNVRGCGSYLVGDRHPTFHPTEEIARAWMWRRVLLMAKRKDPDHG